jgi:serine protease Do
MNNFDDENNNLNQGEQNKADDQNYTSYSEFAGNNVNPEQPTPEQPNPEQPNIDPQQAGPQPNGDYGYYSPYGGNVQYKWNYDDYQKAMQGQQPKKKKRRGLMAFLISVGSVFGVAIITLAAIGITDLLNNSKISINGTTGTSSTSSSANKAVNPSGPSLTINSKPSTTTTTEPLSGQLTTQEIAKKVSPSVVGVLSYTQDAVDPSAEGTGIVMSTDGYIITNEHVIDGANNVGVVLSDGKEYNAKVVGSDLKSDIAVLQISKTGLTPATFGDSSQLEVGETVVAIGNPGGLEFADSVTEGIVSALNRTVANEESGYSQQCIQTDAAINPGNSGGPLVNMYGQVIGITSSKIAETDYENMGFAIPINSVKPIVDDLTKYGYVKNRVKIGITVEEVSDYEAQMNNLKAGLMITAIDPTSDAAAKGLQVRDDITKINGTAITSYDQFYAAESKFKPGDSITLTIYRASDNSTFDVSIKLVEDKGTAQ